MTRDRWLPTPDTATAEYVAALLDAVSELTNLLDARLPAPASADGGEPGRPVKVTEPAPDRRPDVEAVPVSEPADDKPPADDDDEPVEVTEPAPDDRPLSLPPPPPRHGKGSGLDAWQAFANVAKVPYPAGAGRNDIIDACVAANVIPA